MTPAAKRRWFRLSLRTLFVLVTAMACCIGWVIDQLNWIRQRRELLERDNVAIPILDFLTLNEWNYPPWPLGWFGAPAANAPVFCLPAETSDDELARVQALFPEATVTRQ